MSRFSTRYSLAARECSTPGCTRRTARSMTGRCHACTNNLRRFGAVDQTMPEVRELDRFIRRMEAQRARLKLLDLPAIEARWTSLIDDCRGRATPTYKDQKVLSYNGWEREASALIRDVAENLTFTRALDLLAALWLLRTERAFFKSDEAFACCMVEAMRRAANVGSKVVAMNAHNGTISNSYRREVSRNTRLAAAKFLMVGLGAAAIALSRREAARAEQERATRTDYYRAIQAIESEAVE